MKCELCIKSGYSFLSSTLRVDKLLDYAKNNNYDSLGLMDKNVMFGAKEFYEGCKANNIHPIIGVEFDVEDFIVCLIAKDEIGYKNLVKLTSYKNSARDVILTINNLKEYKEGLIAIAPSFRAFKEMNKEKILPLLSSLKDIYLDDFYVGKEIYKNEDCYLLNSYIDTLEFNSVAFNNIVSRSDDELEYIELLNAIDTNTILGYARKSKYDYASFESETSFTETEIDNVFGIVKLCNFEFEKSELKLAKYDNPLKIDSKEYLKNLVYKGLEKRNKEYIKNKRYVDRVNEELNVIFEMGFADYFLVVYDYVKFAKENGILVGPGRGSAASSLVSYCLGITSINPLEYDLLFERFLNKERRTMPDIDIDFQDNKRELVVDYLKNKYGYKKVANIVTFSTLSSKQALRDCAKVLGLSKGDLEKISKKAHKCPYNASLKDMVELSEEFKEFIHSEDKYLDVYKSALVIEDLPRQTSLHAAGVVLSEEDLEEIVPTFSNNGKDLVIQYDMNYVESTGLLKMDLLGLRNLTIIDDCLKEIKRIYGVNIDLSKIDLQDKKLYELLANGKTSGIFQFESDGMRKTLKTIRPENFIDVCNVLALYRPGPREFIGEFNERRHGKKVDYVDESLKEILSSTYGIIVYQEQILQIAYKFAGLSLAKADILRRAMSKKDMDKMKEIKEEFINSCLNKGHSLQKANEVYELVAKFASYGFNKAHSVSYTVISMYMTYLKKYYPSVFYACAMESFTFSNKFNEYASEAKENGIKLLLPSVNHSDLEFRSIKEDEILYGLAHIKGLNSMSAKEIIEEANKKQFVDYSDFVLRMSKYKLSESQYIALIDAGALDEFGLNRATCKNNLDKLLKYAAMFGYVVDGQVSFDFDIMDKPKINVIEEDINKLELEKEVLGYYVSEFPLENERNKLNKLGYICSDKFNNYNEKNIKWVGLYKSSRIIKTKKGELMAIATFVDEFSEISVVIFPRVYKEVSKSLYIGKYYSIEGKLEIKETISLIANGLKEYKLGG